MRTLHDSIISQQPPVTTAYVSTCGRQVSVLLSTPREVLISKNCEYVMVHGEGGLNLQMELRLPTSCSCMERWFWMILGEHDVITSAHVWEREESRRVRAAEGVWERFQGPLLVMKVEEAVSHGLWVPSKSQEDKRTDSSLKLPGKNTALPILILAKQDSFQSLDHQNGRVINLYFFRPLSWW